jgi:hypothetical protein
MREKNPFLARWCDVRQKKGRPIAVCNLPIEKKCGRRQKIFERQSTCAIYSPSVSLFV